MSKSTQTSKDGNQIVETFSNFNESITSNIRNSYGWANKSHGYFYNDRVVPRIESEDISPSNASTVDLRQLNIGDDRASADTLLGLSYASTNALWSKPSLYSGSWSKIADVTTPLKTDTFLTQNFTTNYYMNEDNELCRMSNAGSETDGFLQMEASEGSLSFPQPVYNPEIDSWYYFDKYNVWENNSDFSINSAINKNNASLSLSIYLDITASCVYNAYICIAQYDKEKNKSIVRLWDGRTTTLSNEELFPGGDGEIIAIAELEGQLVSVNLEAGSNAADRNKLSVRIFDGSGMKEVNTIIPDGINFDSTFNITHPYNDGYKLYFTAFDVTFGGSNKSSAIYSVDSTGQIEIAYVEDDASTQTVTSFVKAGNTFATTWGSNGNVSRTTGVAEPTYSYPTILDTLLIDGNMAHEEKQISMIEIPHEPIPTGATLEIQYRLYPEAEGVWTTLKTTGVAEEGTRRTFVTRLPDGSHFPKHFEAQIRAISNGVTLMPFKVHSERINSKPK